jgi:hypothetical protein
VAIDFGPVVEVNRSQFRYAGLISPFRRFLCSNARCGEQIDRRAS